MNCQELRSRVDDLIDGCLSDDVRREMDGHLSRCAVCQAFVDAERAEHGVWFRALNDTADVPSPQESSAVLADRLAQYFRTHRESLPKRVSSWFACRRSEFRAVVEVFRRPTPLFGFRFATFCLAMLVVAGCAAVATVVIMRLPSRTVRDFPGGGWACNTPKVHEVRVARAPANVMVDGDLGEWSAPVFKSACNPPYDKDYSVSARMMWDDDCLYLGGDVRTPDPMRNTQRGRGMTFAGGSVVVRLADDSSVSFPLPYVVPKPPQVVPGLAKLSSFVMYYDADDGRPALCFHHGIRKGYGQSVSQDAWKGAYRRHADGRGYSFEYAMNWSGFGVMPPKPGERRPNHWNIHFSDANGLVCSGQIVENVMEPIPEAYADVLLHDYFFYPVWGTAVFE